MLATLSPNHDVDVVVNAWLPAAARRLVVDLIYCNVVPKSADATAGDDEEEEVEEAGRRGLVELPCFDNATMIHLKLRYQGLVFPPQGIFDKLTILSHSCVRFHGLCNLSTVSEPWCLCLQKLSVLESNWLDNLYIDSKSLLRIQLFDIGRSLQQLTIVTPNLKKLGMEYSLLDSVPGQCGQMRMIQNL
jgi:hypothetical protein